jgi:hypothetical protein
MARARSGRDAFASKNLKRAKVQSEQGRSVLPRLLKDMQYSPKVFKTFIERGSIFQPLMINRKVGCIFKKNENYK